MGLFDRIKSFLGLTESTDGGHSEDVSVTVERDVREDVDATSERAVKESPAQESTVEPSEGSEATDSASTEATDEAADELVDEAESSAERPADGSEAAEHDGESDAGASTDDDEEASESTGETDLQTVKGIGPAYADRLESAGVTSAEELAAEDPAEIAEEIDVSEKQTARWIERASER